MSAAPAAPRRHVSEGSDSASADRATLRTDAHMCKHTASRSVPSSLRTDTAGRTLQKVNVFKLVGVIFTGAGTLRRPRCSVVLPEGPRFRVQVWNCHVLPDTICPIISLMSQCPNGQPLASSVALEPSGVEPPPSMDAARGSWTF